MIPTGIVFITIDNVNIQPTIVIAVKKLGIIRVKPLALFAKPFAAVPSITAIIRTLIGLVPVSLFAIPLFGVSIFKIGAPLIFLLITLYIFGVTLGLLVTAGLVRFGPSFENIAWASLFFLNC